MNRRTFFKVLPVGAATAIGGGLVWRQHSCCGSADPSFGVLPDAVPPALRVDPPRDEGTTWTQPSPPSQPAASDAPTTPTPGEPALPAGPDPVKSRDFDRHYEDDYVVSVTDRPLLEEATARLSRAPRVIGHGHFNIISFDELLRHANHHGAIGAFSPAELAFLEEIFFADARRYGFFGQRMTHEISVAVPTREAQKIRGTGHYLLRGPSRVKYDQLRKDLGEGIILTSGVRGVVKQFQLFLSKGLETAGNLSQASRSLAPPGYSDHAVGDFDVGKVGLGADNFTEAFAETEEYRRMIDLGYIDIRYTEANPFGVRHEPWHIKIG